jgi:hypothetical protein
VFAYCVYFLVSLLFTLEQPDLSVHMACVNKVPVCGGLRERRGEGGGGVSGSAPRFVSNAPWSERPMHHTLRRLSSRSSWTCIACMLVSTSLLTQVYLPLTTRTTYYLPAWSPCS